MKIDFLNQKSSNKEKESAWYRHCQEHNIPYVFNRRRGVFGDVQWDYITMNGIKEGFFYTQHDFII